MDWTRNLVGENMSLNARCALKDVDSNSTSLSIQTLFIRQLREKVSNIRL